LAAAAVSTMSPSEDVDDRLETAAMPNDHYSPISVLLAISLPLGANLCMGEGADFTPALALAGSVGSPLLYGAIPALMLLAQRQKVRMAVPFTTMANDAMDSKRPFTQRFKLESAWPLVGLVSMACVGHEVISAASTQVAI
jgi:hypothetical protein